jgi:hypothetical protein
MVGYSGKLWEKQGITVVELSGSPEQMGEAHGRLLKEKIRCAYFDMVEGRVLPGIGRELFGDDPAKIEAFAGWCRRQAMVYVDRIRPEFQAEMHALAKAADLTWEQVVLAQAMLDTVELAGLRHSEQFFHACTQMAFLPERCAGKTLVARNLDWPSFGLAHELTALFHFIPDDGIPFWSLGFAGTIGTLTVINHEGLIVTEESLTETADVSDLGVPQFIMHRELAQFESTLDGAARRLIEAPRNNGYHTLITSGREGEASTILHSAHHCAIRRADKGIGWGVQLDRRPELYDGGAMPSEHVPLTDDTSDFRYARFKQLIDAHEGPITPEILQVWLADNIDIETGLPGDDLHCLSNDTTLNSFVADPSTGRFWVAMGTVPAPAGGFVEFDIDEKSI